MRKLLSFILLCSPLFVVANELGEMRLERISRYYAAKGRYTLSFVMKAGDAEQKGILSVDGNNSYIRVADTEIFVVDSLRYEVRTSSKEIIVDRADGYEKELFNPLNGFAGVKSDYVIEEHIIDGRIVVRLRPKQSGDMVDIVTGVDGESISSINYGIGENSINITINSTQRGLQPMPQFSKERYKGYELIDFR